MKKLTFSQVEREEGDPFLSPQEYGAIAKMGETKEFKLFRSVAEHIVISALFKNAKYIPNSEERKELNTLAKGALDYWNELMTLVDQNNQETLEDINQQTNGTDTQADSEGGK